VDLPDKIATMVLRSLPLFALRQLKRVRAPWLLLLILALGARPLYLLLGPRGALVTIESKTWRFEIDVERRLLETGADWCDALPAGATELDRRLVDKPDGGRATRCRYSLPAWRKLYVAQALGDAAQPPMWPQPDLQHMAGIAPDALRLGQRHAFFELNLLTADGRRWTCTLPRADWARQTAGVTLRLPVDRFGTADCGKLPRP
jgi:hypothetical protein